jgi:tRNA threonylcarbamoyladenosine biosynthesis protein TsaB
MYLLIDTSTRYGAVGLYADGKLARTQTWSSRNNHTAELMPAVEALLAAGGVRPAELAGIAVAQGPGGFSALRAGLGVAKGLAFANGTPIAGVSTLETSAYPHRGLGMPVCALIDAGRDLVAWARFQQIASGWVRRSPDRVTDVAGMLAARGRHTLFCGEGLAGHAEQVRDALAGRAHLVEEPAPLTRLGGLAELGVARLVAGGDSLAALRPRYLRAPRITQPRPPRSVRYGGGR